MPARPASWTRSRPRASSAPRRAKPRQILITKDQWRQMQSGQPLGEPLPAEDPLPPVEEEILTFDPVPQDFLE
ncbi:MAG: hypothetical protein ACLUNZ_12230 [Evtepia sp.]